MTERPRATPLDRPDWTMKNGRTNASDEYERCVIEVESQLRNLHVGSNPYNAARCIVSTLAHQYGLAPTPKGEK